MSPRHAPVVWVPPRCESAATGHGRPCASPLLSLQWPHLDRPSLDRLSRCVGGRSVQVPQEAAPDSTAPAIRDDDDVDVSAVRAALNSDDAWDREAAGETLAERGRPQVAVPLIRFVLTDRDETVRRAAVEALATLGGDRATEALAIALRDEDHWIRELAIETLEVIGGDQAAQSLTVALQAEDVDLRERAVDALGGIGGPVAIQLLEYAWAGDDDESVREAAAAWLTELHHPIRPDGSRN